MERIWRFGDLVIWRFDDLGIGKTLTRRRVIALLILAGVPARASAAELKPQTVAAFDRYVRLSEGRMERDVADPRRFLWIDTLPEADRQAALAALGRGEVVIEKLRTKAGGRDLDAPDGMIHHWIGAVFVPGATMAQAVWLLQDYDRHADVYRPAVQRSKTLERDGDRFRVYLRFFMKKVLSVVVDSQHDARFTRVDEARAYSRVLSTRIVEIEDPGTPGERAKPVGNDSGFLWRLNTYWRFVERDRGTYVQCESISLSRDIPFGLGWLIGPFVTSIPRESLTFTLATTRTALTKPT